MKSLFGMNCIALHVLSLFKNVTISKGVEEKEITEFFVDGVLTFTPSPSMRNFELIVHIMTCCGDI